jgi:hypothetical protein
VMIEIYEGSGSGRLIIEISSIFCFLFGHCRHWRVDSTWPLNRNSKIVSVVDDELLLFAYSLNLSMRRLRNSCASCCRLSLNTSSSSSMVFFKLVGEMSLLESRALAI